MNGLLTNPTPSYLIGGNQWDAPYALFLKTVFLFTPCSFTRSMVCEDMTGVGEDSHEYENRRDEIR